MEPFFFHMTVIFRKRCHFLILHYALFLTAGECCTALFHLALCLLSSGYPRCVQKCSLHCKAPPKTLPDSKNGQPVVEHVEKRSEQSTCGGDVNEMRSSQADVHVDQHGNDHSSIRHYIILPIAPIAMNRGIS